MGLQIEELVRCLLHLNNGMFVYASSHYNNHEHGCMPTLWVSHYHNHYHGCMPTLTYVLIIKLCMPLQYYSINRKPVNFNHLLHTLAMYTSNCWRRERGEGEEEGEGERETDRQRERDRESDRETERQRDRERGREREREEEGSVSLLTNNWNYRCHIKICPPWRCFPPYSSNAISEPYFIHFFIGTVLLHHSLGLWTVYQKDLGFRLSYRTGIELLYIAIHIIRNLSALLHGWGDTSQWGTDLNMTPECPMTATPLFSGLARPRL